MSFHSSTLMVYLILGHIFLAPREVESSAFDFSNSVMVNLTELQSQSPIKNKRCTMEPTIHPQKIPQIIIHLFSYRSKTIESNTQPKSLSTLFKPTHSLFATAKQNKNIKIFITKACCAYYSVSKKAIISLPFTCLWCIGAPCCLVLMVEASKAALLMISPWLRI